MDHGATHVNLAAIYSREENKTNTKCKNCGESTISKGGEIQKVKTKYPEGLQL